MCAAAARRVRSLGTVLCGTVLRASAVLFDGGVSGGNLGEKAVTAESVADRASRGVSNAAALSDDFVELGIDSVEPVLASTVRLAGRKPVSFIHFHRSAGTTLCEVARQYENISESSANCNEISPFVIDDYHWRASQGAERPTPEPHREPGIGDAILESLVPSFHPSQFLDGYVDSERKGRYAWTTCAERRRHVDDHHLTWFSIERELGPGDFCPDQFLTIGLMREPLSRLESVVNVGEHTDYKQDPQLILDCIRQGDCVERHVVEWEHFDNYYVRTLAGYDAMMAGPGNVTEEQFRAAASVMRRFDLMLPQEVFFSRDDHTRKQVERTMDALVGWHVHHHGPKMNRLIHRVVFTQEQAVEIKSLNRFDYMLYNSLVEQGVGADK